MKTYSKTIITGVLLLSLTSSSCKKDFLDQTPEASIAGNNFYQSEADFKQAVNGTYAALRDMAGVNYWLFGEMRSDNTYYQYNPSDRGYEQREFIDQFLVGATAEPLSSYWQQNYTAIARSNEIISRITEKDFAETVKKQYTGEALFLRAFNYYNLVGQYGGVPLRLETTTAPDEAKSKGRATAEAVYAQIITDLSTAADLLPVKYPAAEAGRATAGTARTLLAKVYLIQKKYGEALAELRKVQGNGYSLLARYADVFSPTNKNSSESIFEVQYIGAQPSLASNFMYQFAPWNSLSIVTGDPGSTLGGGNGWNVPTQDMIEAYEAGDIRKDLSLATGFIDLNGKFQANPYVKKYNHGFVDRGRTDDNFPVLRYADVLLMIAECLNEQGFAANGEAFTLLNQIRERAGLKAKTAGNADPALNIASQDAFRQAILQERRVELAFENHRWYDLVRSGKAVEIMNAHGKKEMIGKITVPSGSYQVTANKLLLPIPQREINLDNLSQNPL